MKTQAQIQDLAMQRKSMRKMTAVRRLRMARTKTAPSYGKEELLRHPDNLAKNPIRDFR